MPKKNESLIHIQLSNKEALNAKREILLSETNLLKILQTIRKYNPLRLEELKSKLKLQKKLKEINLEIKKLQDLTPKIKIPEILQKRAFNNEEINETDYQIKKIKSFNHNNSIETQLQEIQNKLRDLS